MAGAMVALLLVLQACGTTHTVRQSGEPDHTYYGITPELADDPEIARLIAPYATRLRTRMNQVIAWSERDMIRDQPEGILGNMSADIVRFRAIRELGRPVEIAVVNNGGLRISLPGGNITVGHIYELMPFENTITILKLTGEQVQQLADEIAAYGGQPVSGLRFRIQDGRALDILVNYEPLDRQRIYHVATNNFMADGGETLSTLWNPVERIDTNVLIRDAMIEYIRMRRHLDYELEQRIRL